MQQGQVKFYNDQKGFGFIIYDGGDIFFHIRQCQEGYLPQQNDTVTFEVGEGRDGRPSATNVAPVSSSDDGSSVEIDNSVEEDTL